MALLKRTEYGSVIFENNHISATDPCYDKDVWCKIDDVKIKPGAYMCATYIDLETERVSILQIKRKGSVRVPGDDAEWVLCGEIGVDAGIAGFFENKPDYSDDEWDAFCDYINNEQSAWISQSDNFGRCNGFFSSSGYGDGMYDVYGIKNAKGEFVCLEIRFV